MLTAHVFRSIFGWMMGFVAMTWVWAVGIIMAWPWEKNIAWEPDFRLVATCKDNEACSVPYGQIPQRGLRAYIPPCNPLNPLAKCRKAMPGSSGAWIRASPGSLRSRALPGISKRPCAIALKVKLRYWSKSSATT